MPIIDILGIPVDFPKTPYDCQIQYMTKVIEALNNGQNALLESPTGTGKTLCLLCATLAWQKVKQEKDKASAILSVPHNPGEVQIHSQIKGFVPPPEKQQNKTNSSGVIIYATRTHTQLAQVVDELRRSAFRPKMTVLGSREQLCVHERVSKLKGRVLNHSCNTLNAKKACTYRNNLNNSTISMSSIENEILDIEDLTKMGKRQRFCPYFFSKSFTEYCDIIFMPYNYLLDGSIRDNFREQIAWNNAVVIFDEAHNIERIANDSASCSITSVDIATCIQELQRVLRMLKEEAEKKARESKEKDDKNSTKDSVAPLLSPNVSLNQAADLLQAMFALEKNFDNVSLYPGSTDQQLPSATFPGSWLVQCYKQSGFRPDSVSFSFS
jgi:regulator of telomere elongation helicase 1